MVLEVTELRISILRDSDTVGRTLAYDFLKNFYIYFVSFFFFKKALLLLLFHIYF